MLMIQHLLSDSLHYFFPKHCEGCGTDLVYNNQLLCLRCTSQLPYTGFENIPNNPIEHLFVGRLPVKAASSCFYFAKGHLVQHLIHQLKYKHNTAVGKYMGALMGKAILKSTCFGHIDYLIPMPLTAIKEFKRGYNQAAVISEGMSEVMNVPLLLNNICKTIHTDTQTKKHRSERWNNVEGSFIIKKPTILHGKHVLIVDDVITTGATLEACAQALSGIPGIRISVATLATASK
jgi:ComF family protein